MEEVEFAIPESILEALPADGDDAARDMERAVEGWQRRINRAVEASDDQREARQAVADAVERMTDRLERYDQFVPELRAWGQSPIYAIAWRDLYAELIAQLYEHEEIADALDRERNARIVEDGIRWRDVE